MLEALDYFEIDWWISNVFYSTSIFD